MDVDHPDCNSPTESSTVENLGALRVPSTVAAQNQKYFDNLDGTNGVKSIAYDVCLSSNALPRGPIARALPARLRAKLKPIDGHINNQPNIILRKLADRQQRAAIKREMMLQEKKRRARVTVAKLYECASLTREKIEEKQKKASLRRDEKMEETVKKAVVAERSPWFAPDQVPSKTNVEEIMKKQRQAENRRQEFEGLKLKKAQESERSHWYSPDKRRPKLRSQQQLFEKQARAENRRRQYVETKLQIMQQCEKKTKKIAEMMETVLHGATKEELL